jgi:hypothetical protein
MVLFFTTTLGISIVGMVLLVAIKQYELTTGRVIFQSMRPRIHRLFNNSILFVEGILPSLVRVGIESIVLFVVRTTQRFIAQTIVFVEFWLQRTLDFLHMTTHAPQSTTPVSAFLREVAEHKKTILKRPSINVKGKTVREKGVVRE